jgi:putative nucleotidyltransferase with HDIG domain
MENIETVKDGEIFFDIAKMLSVDNIYLNNDIIEEFSDSSSLVLSMPREAIGTKLSELISIDNPEQGLRFLQVSGVLRFILPELSKCDSIQQNPKYHIDTVFNHCVKVCSNTPPDISLRWAGLLHDIGKVIAYAECPIKGITFHKHEVYSTTIAKEIMTRLCINESIAKETVFLVSMHMYNYSSDWTDKTVCRFIKTVGITEDMLNNLDELLLFKLRYADRISRGLEPFTKKQEDFKERIRKVFVGKYKSLFLQHK